MFTILVVCTANVCRSPLAAFSLAQAAGQGIRVVSAGTKARAGQDLCVRAQKALARDAAGRQFAEDHASQEVTPDLIDLADLILVADLTNRTRIAQVVPLARHRAFTFREAESILRGMAFKTLSSELADAMHARRATAEPAQHRRSWLPHRVDIDLNITDGHVLGHREHRRTIRETQAVASAIGLGLERTAFPGT